MPFPKPRYCGQRWEEMKPTEGGRICSQCQKTIVDFSGKTWAEIEARQRANGYRLCGLYAPRQLEYWGQEPPRWRLPFPKTLKLSTLLVALGIAPTLDLDAQGVKTEEVLQDQERGEKTETRAESGEPVVLEGVISDDETGESLLGAMVFAPYLSQGTFADEYGKFHLELKGSLEDIQATKLVVLYSGYVDKEIWLDWVKPGTNHIDVTLMNTEDQFSVFYIEGPRQSFFKRITRPIRRLFRRRKPRKD